MSGRLSALRRGALRLIPALALLLLAGQSLAQLPFQAAKPAANAPAKSAQVANDANPRAKAEQQLAEARRQLEASGPVGSGGALTSERQRLLERLVVSYGERLKLLDELDALRDGRTDQARRQALYAEFAGPPPYSALRVDALRQEFDAERERLQTLASGERALDAQKRTQVELQRRTQEAVRLAEDRLARARNDAEAEKERQAVEVATLRRQLTDAELANMLTGDERIQAERKILQAAASELQDLIARVLPQQRLTKDESDQQQARLRNILNKLAAETERRLADNTRRAAERERLAKDTAAGEPSLEDVRRLKLLDETLETDRVVLMTLNWLQNLNQAFSEAWAQRFAGLSTSDAGVRQKVVATLSKIREELHTRKPLFEELAAGADVAVRDQELRIDSAALDAPAAAHEAAVLDVLRQRQEAYQRLILAAERADRQLERWLSGDFGFSGEAGASYLKVGALELLQKLKHVWDFEMFAVEDSTVVDGKTVTVTYGVTIGKSIGALLLFILGYWLFSRLARRLQRVMVDRFGVNQQLASVIRRWVMISLGLVLLVFILNLARIPLTAFAFMGGALAIGVGFGTQTIIKNVISGIIILFERKIRVGDIIAIGGTTGHVTAVDLRASTVRSFDGVEALVPNSSFLENQVVNWTYSNSQIRREIRIGIAYGSPVHEAADIIAGCAEDHGQVLKDPPPAVFFEDFGDNALVMALVFWVELNASVPGRRIDSDLRFAIEKRLRTAGIDIPFPQRDIRLSVGDALPVQVVPAAGSPPDASGRLPG
ncbi:MAG: mechanosensitive ion channel [Azonexus sp.]|nr:mechanosensitive ion channel [Azonexus sp.]